MIYVGYPREFTKKSRFSSRNIFLFLFLCFWGPSERDVPSLRTVFPRKEALVPSAPALMPHGQLKDIRGPWQGEPHRPWFVCLLGTVGFSLFLALSIYLWQKYHPPLQTASLEEFDASSQLDALLLENLPAQGQTKLFYQKMFQILRQILEKSLEIEAMEKTTQELTPQIQASGLLSSDEKQKLLVFLHHGDAVKFAQHTPTEEERREAVEFCKSLALKKDTNL